MMATSDADKDREETDNFFRLTLLLFRLGNSKLRECLKTHWPKVQQNAKRTITTPWDDKPSDAATLKPILKQKFQFKEQEQKFDSGRTNDWDFSLLSLVLLSGPYKAVLSADKTKALKEMKGIRNTSIGHPPDARISTTVFNPVWQKACKALEKFNAKQEDFDAVEEDIKKPVDILYPILKECCKMEDEILKVVTDLEQNAKERHKEVMVGISKLTEKVDNLPKRLANEPKSSKIRRLQMSKEHQQFLQENISHFQNDFMATELLEHLPCLTEDQKDGISYDEKNYIPSKAVKTLVKELEEHEEGFHQFIRALRKAGLGSVAVLLDGDSGNGDDDKEEKADEEESSCIFYKKARVADIRGTVYILRCKNDSERKEDDERQSHLERKIVSLFEDSRSSEFKELRSIFEEELPKGVYFAHIKKSDQRQGGVHLIFRVAMKAEHLDEIWSLYKDKTLEKLLKNHLLPKALGNGEIEDDLVLKIAFQEKDYKAIKRIFHEESENLEASDTSAIAGAVGNEAMETEAMDTVAIETEPLKTGAMDTVAMETEPVKTGAMETGAVETGAMETKPKKVSLATRTPRRIVYLDDGTYDLSNELQLREYQKELAAPALEGKNTIICAPTNSGKTFVAMEIAKRHLEENKDKEPKVAFIVDKQNLVLQQKGRFEEYLTNYSTADITGAGSETQYLPLEILLRDNDIVVLTAQILVNAMKEKKVRISDISLLVFDECHHANKDHPYNQIMQEYLKLKVNGASGTKKLPQVIGLTASLGVGQSNKEEKAKEHVLRMCANLDASNISTVRENSEELKKTFGDMLECKSIQVSREPDVFQKGINKNMEEIEQFINHAPPTTDREVESYRQWIEALEKDAIKLENMDHFICAQRLRSYHEALLINRNVRTKDAILYLDEYYNGLDQSKFNKTETWLQQLFIKTKEQIENHIQEAGMPENPLLKKLQEQIKGFHAKTQEECQAIGIIFTRTREYARALKRWMEETEELKEMLRPEVLLGSAELTQTQQEQVIKDFKEGKINIIIATTVAEEGLDIPKCNYVIRYGVKGNEISFVQSRGRIRAEEGGYVHLSDAKSRGAEHEKRNEYREMLMTLVVQDAQNMEKDEFLKKTELLQSSSVRAVKKKQDQEEKKKSQLKYVADQSVTFYCKKCNALVCHAEDIRRFKEAHHVVINQAIYERIDIKPHEKPNTFDDIYFGKKINCKKCGLDWGVIMTVEGTELPCLKVASLVTAINHGKVRKLFKKWKDLPFKICEATLEEILQAEDEQ